MIPKRKSASCSFSFSSSIKDDLLSWEDFTGLFRILKIKVCVWSKNAGFYRKRVKKIFEISNFKYQNEFFPVPR
jgi:hypothetical protein